MNYIERLKEFIAPEVEVAFISESTGSRVTLPFPLTGEGTPQSVVFPLSEDQTEHLFYQPEARLDGHHIVYYAAKALARVSHIGRATFEGDGVSIDAPMSPKARKAFARIVRENMGGLARISFIEMRAPLTDND